MTARALREVTAFVTPTPPAGTKPGGMAAPADISPGAPSAAGGRPDSLPRRPCDRRPRGYVTQRMIDYHGSFGAALAALNAEFQ